MITPFVIDWNDERIELLRAQIAAHPLPAAPDGADWELGSDRDFLERFRQHWLHHYDWRSAVADLNRHPQFITEIDRQAIHFVHIKSGATKARPLLLTHGWPGSHYEFWSVIEPLKTAGFDLVIPTLPGYGFSGKPAQPIGPKGTAILWDRLMREVLGYRHYLAQGGDWGSLVTTQIGLNDAGGVRGIHLNMLGLRSPEPPRNDDEQAWMVRSGTSQQRLGGYSAVQTMKPLSLSWLAAGNPLGQAAWILERFHDWADLSQGDLESVFGLNHLITNIMLYVMTDSFGSSLWFYNGMRREGGLGVTAGQRCEVPTGFAAFPGDALMPPPPRSRVEQCFNLVHWTTPAQGGHFAAMENPAEFAADVIEWGEKVWPAE